MEVLKVILTIICIFIVGLIALHMQSFKNWLIYAVSEAEKYFGSKTGELKLRYVYNLAIQEFPFLAKVIPFSLFHKFVKWALKKMDEMIKNNQVIGDFINPTLIELKETKEINNSKE